jgi:hypothetical protein
MHLCCARTVIKVQRPRLPTATTIVGSTFPPLSLRCLCFFRH